MKTLNLINVEKSDIGYKIISFPDGEKHIILDTLNRKEFISIICRIKSANDLFILMQVGDILNRQEIEFELHIYYLMSMRMDRVINFNESFSLKVVANAINSINPKQVFIFEPHSSKVINLINNSHYGVSLSAYHNPALSCYVYPDAGAYDRYRLSDKVAIHCSKIRNIETGVLSGFKIENPELLMLGGTMPLLIIDDLCDGGGTFVGIANEIRKIDPDRELNIIVAHMVNPKGIKTLSDNFDNVWFTNSYEDWQSQKLPNNVNVIEII